MEAITVSAGKRVLKIALLGAQTISRKKTMPHSEPYHFPGESTVGLPGSGPTCLPISLSS